MTDMWDYIIVGAGASGCVLANRLSENPSTKVLLVEAGGADKGLKFGVLALSVLKVRGNPATDWMFLSEPDPSRMARQDLLPSGKVLGGSSSINGTIYVRGNRRDYDHWESLGNLGWGYDSLLPLFRKMENGIGSLSNSQVYGHDGPMKISQSRGRHSLAADFVEAMAEMNVLANPDYNGEDQTGVSFAHVTQRRGWRWSAAKGYLRPASSRSNLRVLTGAFVRKILIEDRRAVGIELEQDGSVREERCNGEVILSASTYNSPKILMLSGIGDADKLRSLGIEVVQPNRNVGRNLHDHPACVVRAYVSRRTTNMELNWPGMLKNAARFAISGGGPASHHFPAVAFVKLKSEEAYPDIQLHFGPFIASFAKTKMEPMKRSGVTILVNVSRPQSRGHVELKSADPIDAPAIQPNLFENSADLQMLIEGVRFARRAYQTKAFGPLVMGDTDPSSAQTSDADLEEFVRSTAIGAYHPVGTNKMGTDELAVVDPRLRVNGIRGLRVVDSSVIPQIPSANTHAISLVIGEKGAEMILQDAPR